MPLRITKHVLCYLTGEWILTNEGLDSIHFSMSNLLNSIVSQSQKNYYDIFPFAFPLHLYFEANLNYCFSLVDVPLFEVRGPIFTSPALPVLHTVPAFPRPSAGLSSLATFCKILSWKGP